MVDEFDIEIGEDDVLILIVGIFDVFDNYVFVWMIGYFVGLSDVYVFFG